MPRWLLLTPLNKNNIKINLLWKKSPEIKKNIVGSTACQKNKLKRTQIIILFIRQTP